jgi:hypothetical protein
MVLSTLLCLVTATNLVTNSAMMTLSEFGNKVAKGLEGGCKDGALFFLESIVEDVIGTAKSFDGDLDSEDLDVISPFLPYAIYKAILISTDALAATPYPNGVHNLGVLMHALHQISRRWLSASMLH